MTEAGPGLPPVAESLLAPLLQWSGEVLREMEAQDVPPAVRPLLSFDRRGFGSTAARAQLRRVLDAEGDFRTGVFEALAGRDEVVALVAAWSPDRSAEAAREAAARDDLALLVSALVAVRPDGWEIGVGAAAALFDQDIEERAASDDQRAFGVQIERAEEARRRAEGRVAELTGEVERLAEELRDERASRRDREVAVRSELQAAEARVAELGQALQRTGEASARAEERGRREAERAGEIDGRSREAQAELSRARRRIEALVREMEALRGAAEAAPRPEPSASEAAGPDLEDEADAGPARPALTRRVPVALPLGVVGPSLEGLRAALAGGDPAVIIDGYNVSMLAWGEAPPDVQRQRLCALLEGLHLRTNRAVVVVFDGADVEGVRPPRRPGVRVLFSDPGEEADDVVVREARALPLERSVIVVSSDRTVQQNAQAAEALVIPSHLFLEFLRK